MNPTVYIIDDDPIYTFSVTHMLKQLDHEGDLFVFSNGKEALDAIIEHDPPDSEELVLLDINMPVMDGWEFLAALPKEERYELMEIYIVTSSISPDDRERAESDERVSGFLVKPISPAQLKTLLEY
jgi:CheY-like chemotaxis protein